MIKYLKYTFLGIAASMVVMPGGQVLAGNNDRAGSAGATELLINPWARSSGWGGANSAGVRGLESQFLNVAGLAFTKKTELLFSHTNWLSGTDIGINSFGLSQKVGASGVLGLGVMSMNFGDIPITTVDQPEGGLGTFSPSFINIGLSYAKEFSNRIYGGITVRLVSEAIADVKASGIAFDAGVQYVTGFNETKDNFKFGLSLKNVSAPMRFSGDGLSYRGTAISGDYQMSVENKSASFELPSLINIGVTYDAKLAKDHRLTVAGSFVANSFTNDQFILGLEYGFKSYLMLRGGFVYEKDIFDEELRTTALTGPCAGVTLEVPLGKGGKTFGVDYSYRATNPFNGTHSFGARLNL
ncbi:MAG: PorV/PorQ family protein [Bacteroidia bacterium]|nr:PorV/PorQ family protein [Bacteroidia bacterium]